MRRSRTLIAALAFAALVATGCEYREVDGVGTRTWDEQLAPQDDITSFDGCTRNRANQWVVDGAVTNHTGDRATYTVTIAFNAPSTCSARARRSALSGSSPIAESHAPIAGSRSSAARHASAS